jgi:Integrin beta chain VWA domain
VTEKKINVIFAIPQRSPSMIDAYGRLSQNIEGSVVGVLDESFANVVDLVRDNYKVCISY